MFLYRERNIPVRILFLFFSRRLKLKMPFQPPIFSKEEIEQAKASYRESGVDIPVW
jgi:hypothetical protein